MQIELSDQVVAFVRRLAPQPRQALRSALRSLAEGRGDIRALEADLAGFYRLRVSRFRVIFHYVLKDNRRILRCEFVEERSLVYQVYAEMARHLKS